MPPRPAASSTNEMLGYPANARLLILNADDFGMCHAVNAAIQGALRAGPIRSTTLMVPCPWALAAMRHLSQQPEQPFGVHLTVISDPQDYRWGPVAGKQRVPSLVDEAGYFYRFDDMPILMARIELSELELEFRAQIETTLAAGLRPTHLDWHALRFNGRTDILDLMISLAREYGLALRVIGRPSIEKVRALGLPCIDYDFLDSYGIDPADKPARFARLLRELPAGLSEWAIHPGLDTPEFRAIEPTSRGERQTDFDFWTSARANEIIASEGIVLLDYSALRSFWKAR